MCLTYNVKSMKVEAYEEFLNHDKSYVNEEVNFSQKGQTAY